MEIADGLKLLPGEDGVLPVRPRWVAVRDTPEAFAVSDGVVYVAGSELTAFNLRDGSIAWECQGEHPFEASGGVVIGLDGPDFLRVVAPFEYDLRVDRRTGRLLSLHSPSEVRSAPIVALPAPRPSRVRVTMGLREIVARWLDGSVAWRLDVESPFVDGLSPVQADDAIVLVTSGQHVVVLDEA